MKLSFLKIIVSLTISIIHVVNALGHNRIATEQDISVYGPYITPGDLIIDTPTKIAKDKGSVVYYFMSRQWPGLKEGVTIWFDGDKLGILDEIKFCNTSNPLTPWHISSATFRNIPHTQVIATTFFCQGLMHFELNGETSFFPGLSDWPSSRKFLTGAFGFRTVNNIMGGHGFIVNVRDGGTIKLNGFEAQHGFSGVRINGGNYDITLESIEISNFYIHDTGNGEGQYLGATHKAPLAKLKNLKVHHGIITRTAAEALQVQHLVGGADIHHITIFAADVSWMHEFMSGQDTGIQWCVDAGENSLHHILVDGFSSIGLMPFGSKERPTGGVSKISNILFNDGRDTGMFLHESTRFGVHWVFDSLYFRNFNAFYYRQTGRKERDYFISKKNGTDRFTFSNIFHDGSKPKVFQDTSKIEIGRIVEKKLPGPEYRNSGFLEPANKIKQWHQYYGSYFPISKTDTSKVKVPTQWDAGEIAIETNDVYLFYKCIKTHSSSADSPQNNPYFFKLSWDANGIRNDQRGWNSSLIQSDFPPDDFRLKVNNYWEKLGIGYQESLNE